jgi:hypothetical protein
MVADGGRWHEVALLMGVMSEFKLRAQTPNIYSKHQKIREYFLWSVQTCPNRFGTGSQNSRDLRTENRTGNLSGRTELELNRTIGSVRPVPVLCISSELNFGNTNLEGLVKDDSYTRNRLGFKAPDVGGR